MSNKQGLNKIIKHINHIVEIMFRNPNNRGAEITPLTLEEFNGMSFEEQKPLILYAEKASDYLDDYTLGDEALNAIMTGRQILVRVPNADGGQYTAIYSPVLMHQVPNYSNKYLYLFYLKDEKQDLSSLGLSGIQMPTYGQLKMLLSKEYYGCPLEDQLNIIVENEHSDIIYVKNESTFSKGQDVDIQFSNVGEFPNCYGFYYDIIYNNMDIKTFVYSSMNYEPIHLENVATDIRIKLYSYQLNQ